MSGGGGSQGGTQNQTSQVILPSFINDAAQKSLANAQTLSERPYQADPNAQVASLTPDQQQAYSTIRGMQGATDPAFQASMAQAQGLLGSAAPITAGQINADTASLFNPYTTAVVDPTVAKMREALGTTLSGVGTQYANAGAFGGSRQGVAEGTAIGNEATGEGQLVGGLLSQGYQNAQNAALSMGGTNLQAGMNALTLLPNLATGQQTETMKEAAALEGVGRAQQGQSQAELNQASANWQAQWNYPLQQQAILQSALTSTPYGGTTQTTGTSTAAPKTVGSRLAGIGGGALAGAAVGSMVPGIGTAIGAVGGGLLGLMGSF